MEEYDIEDIVYSYLFAEDTYIQPHNMIEIEYPFDIDSEQYLQFAKYDLQDQYNRMKSTINAISNTKRAIESRVDAILHIYGIKKLHIKIHGLNSFSEKLSLLNRMGVVAPNILKRINSIRNKVEHKYIVLEHETVADYVDIAELFLEATQVSVKRFINEFSLESETINEYWLDCSYDFEKASFNIEINYHADRTSEMHAIKFDRKELEYNQRFLQLFSLAYKVALNPPYK